MDNSILRISCSQNSLVGTGFAIDYDIDGSFIATCGHVVNSCSNDIMVAGQKAKVVINKYEEGLDLAILYVHGLKIKPLPVIGQEFTDTVDVIGYSKLMDDPKREAIRGIRTKPNVKIEKNNDTIIRSIKLYPAEQISSGYSGSPVICNKTKSVVGIINIQAGDETNYAICSSHIHEIHEFINSQTESKKLSCKKELSTKISNVKYDDIKNQLENNLTNSLRSFSSIKAVWVEPRIYTKEEDSNISAQKMDKIKTKDIVDNPSSIVFRARQQYGLTCLSHYLVLEAWKNSSPSFWLYLDANELKPTKKEIEKHIKKKIDGLGLSYEDIECIILDEFSDNIKNASKIVSDLNELFIDIPILIMWTIIDNPILKEAIKLPSNREFKVLFLWALPRSDIRQVVCAYNNERYVGEENAVVTKVVSDLEVLNIPRTALNCLTILKIYEAEFDESPVNRTEMIRRVLHLLFNIDDIPHYKSRPDLKDTEYILGYFCEKIIRSNQYFFSREEFLEELNFFCEQNEIEVETHVIFDVLYVNNIIVSRDFGFCFKFTYWVFYFAAHRMLHNDEFANYILSEMNYASYPELIEFYTGIDRRRDNALEILIKDIRETRIEVEDKCGFPPNFNIYDMAQWTPSDRQIESMQEEVANGTLNSNLPIEIKDEYADKGYDRRRPLNQTIHKILENYSLLRLIGSVHAGCKALRNSDYSKPELRHKLVKEILRSWEQTIKVLVMLAPIMAKKGYATVDGACFVLVEEDFHGTSEDKFYQILQTLPSNLVHWYKDDMFSKKMAPLLYNYIEGEDCQLLRHTLNLLIIHKRPKGWDSHIENVIFCEDKNSFYLGDIYATLKSEYQFGFVSNSTLTKIGNLIKKAVAKHQKGIDRPGNKVLRNKSFDRYLPPRESD